MFAFYVLVLLFLAGLYLFYNHQQYLKKRNSLKRPALRNSIGTVRSSSSPVMKQLHIRGNTTRSPGNQSINTINSSPVFFSGNTRNLTPVIPTKKLQEELHPSPFSATKQAMNIPHKSTGLLVEEPTHIHSNIHQSQSKNQPLVSNLIVTHQAPTLASVNAPSPSTSIKKPDSTPAVSTKLKHSFSAIDQVNMSSKRKGSSGGEELDLLTLSKKSSRNVLKKAKGDTTKKVGSIEISRIKPLKEVQAKVFTPAKAEENSLTKKRKHDEEKPLESKVFWIGPNTDKRAKIDRESISLGITPDDTDFRIKQRATPSRRKKTVNKSQPLRKYLNDDELDLLTMKRLADESAISTKGDSQTQQPTSKTVTFAANLESLPSTEFKKDLAPDNSLKTELAIKTKNDIVEVSEPNSLHLGKLDPPKQLEEVAPSKPLFQFSIPKPEPKLAASFEAPSQNGAASSPNFGFEPTEAKAVETKKSEESKAGQQIPQFTSNFSTAPTTGQTFSFSGFATKPDRESTTILSETGAFGNGVINSKRPNAKLAEQSTGPKSSFGTETPTIPTFLFSTSASKAEDHKNAYQPRPGVFKPTYTIPKAGESNLSFGLKVEGSTDISPSPFGNSSGNTSASKPSMTSPVGSAVNTLPTASTATVPETVNSALNSTPKLQVTNNPTFEKSVPPITAKASETKATTTTNLFGSQTPTQFSFGTTASPFGNNATTAPPIVSNTTKSASNASESAAPTSTQPFSFGTSFSSSTTDGFRKNTFMTTPFGTAATTESSTRFGEALPNAGSNQIGSTPSEPANGSFPQSNSSNTQGFAMNAAPIPPTTVGTWGSSSNPVTGGFLLTSNNAPAPNPPSFSFSTSTSNAAPPAAPTASNSTFSFGTSSTPSIQVPPGAPFGQATAGATAVGGQIAFNFGASTPTFGSTASTPSFGLTPSFGASSNQAPIFGASSNPPVFGAGPPAGRTMAVPRSKRGGPRGKR